MTPRLPGGARTPQKAQPNGGTWIAMLFVLFVVGGFIALMSQIMPQVAGIVLVVAGLFFFIAFHYFTWGRWLMSRMHDLQDENEDS